MTSEPSPPEHSGTAEIRRRMAELRSSMRSELVEINSSAKTLTDWTSRVRRHPLAVAGAAAAARVAAIPGSAGEREPIVSEAEPGSQAEPGRRTEPPAGPVVTPRRTKTELAACVATTALTVAGKLALKAATALTSQQQANGVSRPTAPSPVRRRPAPGSHDESGNA